MTQLNLHASNSTPPPTNLQLIPLLQRTKDLYLLWYGYYKVLPKEHRYTLGGKIDNLLTEIIEAISSASFLVRAEKQPYIKMAIRKTDAIKIFLLILWETKSLNNQKYLALSEKIEAIGRMLGGWNGQLTKQNSLTKK
ncbi:hypothetical protein COX21_00150 [Candidatus Falkowbacteria bacterium CG23_combo_of_CG06-09_8_20_14_all_41_10]|uniref:bAvd-like domain-containing protein n=1 Tax=Candidatus Falkowbacteria bacterium CG23_combo_of_CG06-09_8_20_14_all_41_10 TaxID=1974571 RepID=A0A2G9ZP45_9BACT|nr:MAG: hypothetical protein COX21_00150 [Candidatus Falkowbacteria bacterium CG23_combo_of_CG06-09_8_20_14_all_41_10]